MNLEAVTAELRPRGAWEAADFGARLVRRDAGVIYKTWFAVTLPVLFLALLCIWFLPAHGWIQFGYWWLEPLFDGPILYIISRRLFGEATDAKTALRAAPGLARRNWVFLLTPLRLHFARSTALPLTQLEHLSGARRRARAKVLNQVTLNHGIGVTAAYQHLVWSVYFGIVLLAFAFIPEIYYESLGLNWFDQVLQNQGRASAILNLVLFYLAQTALHPWFVGAGFGLYINCRTMLEAWDIEVAFRRMLQRRAARLGASAAAVLLLVSFAGLTDARAESATLAPWWDADTVEEARESVYADDAFKRTETDETWQRIDTDDNADTREPNLSGVEKFFRGVGRFVAFVVEFGLWILVAAVVVLLAVTAKRWLPYLNIQPRARRQRRRVVLASGEITADSLPDDVPGTVLALWRDGRARDALSLLYRSSVFAAVQSFGVRLPKSATEGACMSAVESQTESGHASYFERVVGAWVWCAYGARPPADDAVLALCAEWPQHYERSE